MKKKEQPILEYGTEKFWRYVAETKDIQLREKQAIIQALRDYIVENTV
jgi:hypothetical protein